MPTQAKPMNEKSYKEEFLDMIRKKSGLLTAIRMEEALKNDSKQIKEAQIDQGLPLEGIAQTQGVDLNKLLGNKTPEPQQAPQPQTQAQEPTYTEKPASSPFGFGGYDVDAQNNVTRQKPGFIGGFLGGATAQEEQLQNALLLQKLLGSGQEQTAQNTAKRKENYLKLNAMQSGPSFISDQDLQDPFISKIAKPIIEKFGIEPIVDEEGNKIYSLEPLSYYKTKSTVTGREEATRNIKREDARSKLNDFMEVDNILDEARSEGGLIGRTAAGASMWWKGMNQSTPLGMAVKQHDALRGNLALAMNRAFGDVGPVREDERKIAMEMLPLKSDSKGLAQLKRSYLDEIFKSFDDKDQEGFKSVIKKWRESQGKSQQGIKSVLPPNKAKRLAELRRKYRR
jgi:hypothetical protein